MRFILIFCALILFVGCYEGDRKCSDFKTGTFKFEALVGTELFTTTIVRNDTLEVDYYQGKADSSSIRWINDCEYIIKKINPKNQAEKKAIQIKILSTSADEYTFEFREVGKVNASKGTAKRARG